MFSLKLALVLTAVLAVNANADVFPKVVNASFNTGYIPMGFDTNDNVQLVAEGIFPNTCYKPASVKAVVSHEKKTIHLYPRAYKYDGVCLQMLVPYNREIDVGLLEVGDYKVVNVTGAEQKELGMMKVATATNSNPDDFLYAPVSQAFMEAADGRHFVTITGEFPMTCFTMREVIVRVQPNVLVVQPIAEQTGEVCEARPLPYKETVEVNGVKEGRYLLHVRSLNGKAINNLVDVR